MPLFKKKEDVFQLLLDYKQTFSSPQGKRVLADICKRFHALQPSYVQGDAMETANREGERYVALYILKQMDADITQLRELMKEEKEQ